MSNLPAPRKIPNIEATETASACARMFPASRFSYLRSALDAAVVLATAPADYLDRMDNRAYHQRVRDTNLAAYRRAAA